MLIVDRRFLIGKNRGGARSHKADDYQARDERSETLWNPKITKRREKHERDALLKMLMDEGWLQAMIEAMTRYYRYSE